jgi:hypothetical protein
MERKKPSKMSNFWGFEKKKEIKKPRRIRAGAVSEEGRA